VKLASSCDSCVANVCAKDGYCCRTKWDQQCVNEVGTYCSSNYCSGNAPDMSAPPDLSGGGGGGSGGGGGGGGSGGPVGPNGGNVTFLHFGMTGDTRPPSCEDTAGYPTAVINAIADAFEAQGAQFALDLGDHMYVCNNSLPTADAQMSLYMTAIARFKATWFMTMGNHECYGGLCAPSSTNANYVSYMKALSPIAKLPYYSFDVGTSKGLARFVIVADNAWDSAQATWLENTLADADGKATYTLVARHHPEGDSSVSTNSASMAIIRKHKFALFLSGHSHLYNHMTTDNGRDIVLGIGGAPLIAGGAFHGYALVDQQPDGQLKVTVYDLSKPSPVDTWSVGPNQ
jgi:hypothetical protein